MWKAQIWTQHGTWVQMKALCISILGAPHNVTAILEADNQQKLNKIEPLYLNKYKYWCEKLCGFFNTLSTTFLVIMLIQMKSWLAVQN